MVLLKKISFEINIVISFYFWEGNVTDRAYIHFPLPIALETITENYLFKLVQFVTVKVVTFFSFSI